MEEREKELCETLKETYRALALVTFFSRHRHPDQETADAIESVLDRARKAVSSSEEARKTLRSK
jgi:hypothetical protein